MLSAHRHLPSPGGRVALPRTRTRGAAIARATSQASTGGKLKPDWAGIKQRGVRERRRLRNEKKKNRRRLILSLSSPPPSGDDLLSKLVNVIIGTKPLYALLTVGAKSVSARRGRRG